MHKTTGEQKIQVFFFEAVEYCYLAKTKIKLEHDFKQLEKTGRKKPKSVTNRIRNNCCCF